MTYFLAWIVALSIVSLILLVVSLTVLPMLQGAIYFPTHPIALDILTEVSEIKPGERALDIGSGDGRIAITLAQAGADATGCEINPFLVWLSRQKAKKAGLKKTTHFLRKDLWLMDFSTFDVLVVFGIPHIMDRLEQKIQKECRPGTRIISYVFPLPNLSPELKQGGLYRYRLEDQSNN